jgi:hypothetical protein
MDEAAGRIGQDGKLEPTGDKLKARAEELKSGARASAAIVSGQEK